EKDLLEIEVERILNNMTIEEKIGQLFIIAVRNSFNNTRMLHADEYMRNIINVYKPGGIILFTVNFDTPEQTRDLIRETQLMSEIPLFFAVDEEGGNVARLGNSERMSVTLIPPAAVIGRTNKTEYAAMASKVISSELKALGFNMNMAPVADVNTNIHNQVIGNRTYSQDPFEAGKMVAAVTEAMNEENMISVLKHFPGHGDTDADTHVGEVILNHNKERLERIEFIPFKMGISAGADAIMIAHIKVPLVSLSDLPATMSSVLLQDILRDELGFNGIIITDAMDMGAIKNNWSADEAAINAFIAGVDIILMPTSLKKATEGIGKALDNKVISLERINESVRRILRVKIKRGLFSKKNRGSDDLKSILGSEDHKNIIKTITE
nr:glycoside hydrolase family 3 protein [Spirochaetaceae bacterium]